MKDKRRDLSDLKYYNRLFVMQMRYKESNLFDKELWDNVKLSRSIISEGHLFLCIRTFGYIC